MRWAVAAFVVSVLTLEMFGIGLLLDKYRVGGAGEFIEYMSLVLGTVGFFALSLLFGRQ